MRIPVPAWLKDFGTGLAVAGWLAASPAAAAETGNVDRCVALAADMSLGAPLPHTRDRLREGKEITIVAFGSSSTIGVGTFGKSFPEVIKGELSRLYPSLAVHVIISGKLFDTIPGNLQRIDHDVTRFQPDLVVWQLGTNDVLWRGIAANAKELVRGGVQHIKASGADLILMDLQYAPALHVRGSHADMEKLIADSAREEAVGLFPRYELMKRAHENGVGGLVAWDGLHNSGAGYRCIGLALARMIDKSARDTAPTKPGEL